MKPPKRGKLCAPGINRSRYRFGIGPPHAAGERAGGERKTACEIFGTDFYAVKSGWLCRKQARQIRRLFTCQKNGSNTVWCGYPFDRWTAGSDSMRESNGLRALQLPGRSTLRVADAYARCA